MHDATAVVWLTTEQVAARTQYSIDTVQDAAATGDLPSFQRSARGPRRYHVEQVDAWVRGESPSAVAPLARPA